MIRSLGISLLTVGALLAVGGASASAQVVIGGFAPEVEVNWAVLDQIGPPPNLPGMLKPHVYGASPAAPAAATGSRSAALPPALRGVAFKPYKPEPKKPAPVKPARVAKPAPEAPARGTVSFVEAAPAKAAPAKAAPVATVQAEAVEAPKAETVAKPVGPQISLPSTAPVGAPTPIAPPPAAKPAAMAEAAKPAPEPVKPVAVAEAPKPAPEPVKPAAVVEPPKPVAPVVKAEPAAPPPALPQPMLTPPPAPQIAALPTPSASAAPRANELVIPFAANASSLPSGARADLDRLARALEKDESLALQILAYAAGDDSSAGDARRLSLTRAVEVRNYLFQQGVRTARVEVRALGHRNDGGQPDRVDVLMINR